jgi:hypothetical protein
MATSVRSQFKATPIKTLKDVTQQENAVSQKGGGSDRLAFTNGTNKFRILPKHAGEETYAKMRCIHWVLVENDKGEQVKRTVNNSKVHGGTKKDIIEEYIAFVKENLNASKKDEADKIKAVASSWDGGLGMQTSWICYALKIVKGKDPEFGKLEYKTSVRDAMSANAFVEDGDEALEIEPFTDPDTGLPIIVVYNSDAKKAADYYKTTLSKHQYPLSDEFLEFFSKKTPLSQLPEFNYRQEDFEQAVEGIRIYDENHEINLFDTDEFQAIVREVGAQYAGSVGSTDDGEDDKKKGGKGIDFAKKTAAKKTAKPADDEPEDEEPEEEAEAESDVFDSMDRNELKIFKRDQGIESFTVTKNMTDDEIRDKLRELVSFEEEAEEEPEEPPFEEEADEEPEEETPPAKTVKKVAATVKTVKKPAPSEEPEDDEEEAPPSKTAVKPATKSAEDIKAKLDALKKKK